MASHHSLLALVGLNVIGSAYACANTGQSCYSQGKGTTPCCKASATPPDKCEAVDNTWSMCVSQPKCALANQQCAGAGRSVMEKTPCCDTGYTCTGDQWYSSCQNVSVSPPPPLPPFPPPPPKQNCSGTGNQCDPLKPDASCCVADDKCEKVNAYYAKCVNQPKCAADNAACAGKNQHVMTKTPCCTATSTCSPWGDDWSLCRVAGTETCAVDSEQCFGTGGSAMKKKSCCVAGQVCTAINPYYSTCQTPPSSSGVQVDAKPPSCPGLLRCPTGPE